MPQSFSYEFTMSESPTKARARVRRIVNAQILEAADMVPIRETADSMAFRPRWGWPLAAAAMRRIRGENITLEFRATDLGTAVSITGRIAGYAEVASREFWTKTLAVLTSRPIVAATDASE